MMCSETRGFEMSRRILSEITNDTLGMLSWLVLPTVIALLGPQASSPAFVTTQVRYVSVAGEDACGPRRAITVALEGLLKGNAS